ncbi:DNA ligase [candidate division GN15 bacterium]|nr:DNA ligase [candidate division GN15 bacterium]
MAKKLSEYSKKRDLRKSPEPKAGRKKGKGKRIFVIQKHDASTLHYDFRLEIDGVLKSWALPKGPSTDPSDKRLAINTEDHPYAYKDFEGVIPEGEYGAGAVLVWDTGTYENIKKENGRTVAMQKCFDRGHIEIRLEGQKLSGGFVLTKLKKGKKDQWLFIKMKDDAADARRNPVSTEPRSVLSGRTILEIEKSDEQDPDQ